MSGAIRLYELVLENGRSSSPYVWRIRYALGHKGLDFETVPVGFTGIPKILGGRYKTLPVLTDGETAVGDSWEIAAYLDAAFPHRPALFHGPGEYSAVRLHDEWQAWHVMRKLFALYALDIHDAARPEDRAYFRQSRERLLKGKTLEEFTANRVSQVPEARAALMPLRNQLRRFAFLGGAAPNYADYIALGAFQWVASVGTLPLLAADDELLRSWLERCADLYGGIGRDPRAKPLFEAAGGA
jgi:glutathione S-transferase